MLRGIYGDPERFVQQYWSKWKDGVYFTGDGARVDQDGYYWLLGRVDDVLNVAGHRIGTMEVESALVDHPKVAEAAVVGKAHEIKGQAVAAFVTLKEGVQPSAGARRRAQGARRQEDRRDRAARSDSVRRRPAEDAIGQDHAPPAPRHRRRQGARRHDDAGRSRTWWRELKDEYESAGTEQFGFGTGELSGRSGPEPPDAGMRVEPRA